MQPAPPSPSSGGGRAQARPLVEFAARCPNLRRLCPVPWVPTVSLSEISEVCIQPHTLRDWCEVRLAAPWSCCPHAPAPGPRGRRREAGSPGLSRQVVPYLHRLTALCLSLQPPRLRLQEQLHHQSSATPATRPPAPARCGSPTRCRTPNYCSAPVFLGRKPAWAGTPPPSLGPGL